MRELIIMSVCVVASYLLGAIPNGLLLTRMKGVNIRSVGSGNIGATNVFRSVSKPLGITTFLLDLLKGLIPTRVFPWLAVEYAASEAGLPLMLLCGCTAILGHNWPVYVGFKGGKGVATSTGVLLGVAPAAVGIGVLTWIALFLGARYVSVASMGAALILAGSGWFIYLKRGPLLPATLTLLALLVLWRHRENIRRLMNGSENRFDFKERR